MSIVAVSEFVFSELLHETKHIAETIEAKIIPLTAIDVLILIQVQSYKSARSQNSRNATIQKFICKIVQITPYVHCLKTPLV